MSKNIPSQTPDLIFVGLPERISRQISWGISGAISKRNSCGNLSTNAWKKSSSDSAKIPGATLELMSREK